jgi:hypothetical protein
MPSEIDELVSKVRDAADPSSVFPTIDAWAQAGRAHDLVALFHAVVEANESVAHQIEETLALTQGDAFVDAALEIARGRSLARQRAIASRLGHGQTKATFLSAASRLGEEHTEILACWMHELVLRGTRLDADDAATALHQRLLQHDHVLGRLPLELLSVETEAPSYMPMYGNAAIQRAVATLESGAASTRTIPPPGERKPPTVTRVVDAALEARLVEAFRPWIESSSGKSEAKVFTLAPAVDVLEVGRWLVRALALESLASAKDVQVQRVEVEVAWGGLFAAAANGGAYSSGLGGAYGRRAAWTSLGALVGAEPSAPVVGIDELACESALLLFRASGPWFHDVAWDLGIAALRPDGDSVAVVAATDCD